MLPLALQGEAALQEDPDIDPELHAVARRRFRIAVGSPAEGGASGASGPQEFQEISNVKVELVPTPPHIAPPIVPDVKAAFWKRTNGYGPLLMWYKEDVVSSVKRLVISVQSRLHFSPRPLCFFRALMDTLRTHKGERVAVICCSVLAVQVNLLVLCAKNTCCDLHCFCFAVYFQQDARPRQTGSHCVGSSSSALNVCAGNIFYCWLVRVQPKVVGGQQI